MAKGKSIFYRYPCMLIFVFILALASSLPVASEKGPAGKLNSKEPSRLETKALPAPSSQVFTHKREPLSRTVTALPAPLQAGDKELVAQLKQARRNGELGAAAALQMSLDGLYGINPNPPSADGIPQAEIDHSPPSGKLALAWVEGDVLVTNPAYDEVSPSIASAPNGDLYVAVQRLYSARIIIYRSTDNGRTWSWLSSFVHGDDARHPSITYAETSTGKKIYGAYELEYGGTGARAVCVFYIDPDNPSITTIINVQSDINMTSPGDHIYPRIASDNLLYPTVYYLYLTYALYAIDYYPVYFTRSTDYGVSWSIPANLTGGAENSQWSTRPDIAFGSSGLFIAFEKLGWSGASWDNQVFVTKSNNSGTSWSTPTQLTDSSDEQYHPRVAVSMGDDTILVALTRYWEDNGDLDVTYLYSEDAGSTWLGEYTLPWTNDDEKSVDLAVSNYQGNFHTAYWHESDIWYTSAPVTDPLKLSIPFTVVNEINRASSVYTRPAVTVNPNRPLNKEAAIVWTDYRGTYYDVYFDSPGLSVSLPFIPLLLLDE